VDISDPSDPEIVGEYAGATQASSIRIDGDTAYVARRNLGVDIIDLSNAEAPSLIGNYDTSGTAFQAAPMSNNRLAVADDFNGTLVLDISTPASPTPAGSYSADYAFALTALDNQVFVLSPGYRPSVLRSVDFTTPGSPMVHDELRLPGISRDVRTAGTTIIVANDANGMVLLDASNPEQPAYANRVANDFGYSAVEWVNNVAVGGSFGQFDVVNIANPYSPVLIKAQTFAEDENVLDMDRFGNRLYVALGAGGLKVYDMTSPASPVLLGTFVPAVGGVAHVAVHGDLAFVSAGDNFVRAVNLANLALPAEVGSIDMGSIVQDMDYAGSSLFVATQAQEVRNLVFRIRNYRHG
jgi:hypothetical protein